MIFGELYVDLDGVTCDFDKAIADRGVLKNDTSFIHTPKEHWTIDQAEHDKKVREIMGQPGFWESIPPMEDYWKLWTYCQQYDPYILTAVPHVPEWQKRVAEEKRNWAKKYLKITQPDKIICCLRSEKKDWASEDGIPNILIDDMISNIKEWNDTGGIGILHTSARDSVVKLDHLIND